MELTMEDLREIARMTGQTTESPSIIEAKDAFGEEAPQGTERLRELLQEYGMRVVQ